MNKTVLEAILLALIMPATAIAGNLHVVQMFPKLIEQKTGLTDRAVAPVAASGKPGRHPLDSAPPLSRIVIYAVGSTQIGYGGTPIVYMAGSLLPSSAQYLHKAICITGSLYTSRHRGQTVVGWYRYYHVDGYREGSFQYQNTFLNSSRTLSKSILVR